MTCLTVKPNCIRRLRWPLALWLLAELTWSASSQNLDMALALPAYKTVEMTAQQITEVVTRTVPDQPRTVMYVDPIQTDTGSLTRLGSRLRGVLQVKLLREYQNARLRIDTKRMLIGEYYPVHVIVELHPYEQQVVALIKIFDRDGLLLDADLIALPRSIEISTLLKPETQTDKNTYPEPLTPVELEKTIEHDLLQTTETAPDPEEDITEPQTPLRSTPDPNDQQAPLLEEVFTTTSIPTFAEPDPPQTMGQPDTTTEPSPPARKTTDDPYEPDDVAGFEIPVPLVDQAQFERTLNENDRDRFELSIPTFSLVSVSIETDLEPLIVLYRPGSAVPFGLREGGFTTEMEAGTYVVEVLSADTSETGPYTLTITTSDSKPVGDNGVANYLAPKDSEQHETIETEADALAQPTEELESGAPQERLLRKSPEWFQLTARPGQYYSLTVQSDSKSIAASLHSQKNDPAFFPLIRSTQGNLVGALFIGARTPLLQVYASPEETGINYMISLAEIAPPMVFADQSWTEQAQLGPIQHHNLRIFNQDIYQISLESTSAAFTDLVVLAVPSMSTMGPQDPGLSSYELVQGDYLVLVHPLDEQNVGRACWHLAKGSSNCH